MFDYDFRDLFALPAALLFLVVYLLPSLIAFNRGVHRRWLVLVVNLVFGSSVIGWFIALYLATRRVESRELRPL